VAAVAAVGLGACGDGGGERLTAEELRTRANAICADLQEDVQGAFADLQPDDEPTAYQGAIAKLLVVVDDAAERLADLEPPAELEARYDEALAAFAQGEEAVREAGRTPEASATVFAGETDPFDEANAAFDGLGLTTCGTGSTGTSP